MASKICNATKLALFELNAGCPPAPTPHTPPRSRALSAPKSPEGGGGGQRSHRAVAVWTPTVLPALPGFLRLHRRGIADCDRRQAADADQQAYFRALFEELNPNPNTGLDRAPRQEDHEGAFDDELVDYNPRRDDSLPPPSYDEERARSGPVTSITMLRVARERARDELIPPPRARTRRVPDHYR